MKNDLKVPEMTGVRPTVLAVDLGLRTGLALFDGLRRVVWFKSQNMGSVPRLRRAIPLVLASCQGLTHVVVEGDRHLGELWQKDAERRGAAFLMVAPETWRAALFLSREQRTGPLAKRTAGGKALEIVEDSITPRSPHPGALTPEPSPRRCAPPLSRNGRGGAPVVLALRDGLADDVDDDAYIRSHRCIREAQDHHLLRAGQLGVAQRVLPPIVMLAVELDGDPGGWTVEVDHEPPERMLSTNRHAKLSGAHLRPKDPLFFRLATTKRAGARPHVA
jgi:hypothetical protein